MIFPEHRFLKGRELLLVAIAVLSLLGIFMMPPVPQPVSYHDFAGEQQLFGITNFWNVVSNLPFLLVGLAGLHFCAGNSRLQARMSWSALFAGVAMVAFGSTWYHLSPVNSTLVWDRLPMAMGFMGLFVALLIDYADVRSEKVLLLPFMALGVGAVVYWAIYDDLRLYIWVQFFPLLSILILLVLFKSRYQQNAYIIAALGLYVLAKGLETADDQLYDLSDHLVAGHPIKHLVAAAGVYLLLHMLKHRKLA